MSQIKKAIDLKPGDILELELDGIQCLPIKRIVKEFHPIYKKQGIKLYFEDRIWSWILPTDEVEVLYNQNEQS